MEFGTLNVTRQQAAEAVIQYRRALKLHRNAEDEAILRGYNQVLKGRKLIELSKVIAAGGADAKSRPRLAVMRADRPECWVSVENNGSVTFSPCRWVNGRTPACVRLPSATLSNLPPNVWVHGVRSIVPTIPPQYRPPDALANYHILWEADWETVPADPALLKHLGGDLWAVLAVWDLTELERAVLAGRRTQ